MAKMNDKDKINAARKEAIAAGLCYICGKKPAVAGKRRCQACIDRHSQSKKARRLKAIADGLCASCYKVPPVEGKTLCAECARRTAINSLKWRNKDQEHIKELRNKYAKAGRARAEENGLCLWCWKNPADPGYKSCSVCRSKVNERRRQKREGLDVLAAMEEKQ